MFVFIWHGASEKEIKEIKNLIYSLKVESSVRLVGKKNYKGLPIFYNLGLPYKCSNNRKKT